VLLDDVPLEKSYFSIKSVLCPLEAESIAAPIPDAPPPIITISHYLELIILERFLLLFTL